MKRKMMTSPYVTVRRSSIHSRGIFAKKNIPDETQIIEYVGEKITKSEANRRADIPLAKAKKDKVRYGAVYIFELNKRHDVDGNVAYNTAKFINHSCDPNCETEIVRGKIWIMAIRDIEKGEELSYDYGYDFDDYHEHECFCGSRKCIGFIVSDEHWPKVRRHQKKKQQKKKIPLKKN